LRLFGPPLAVVVCAIGVMLAIVKEPSSISVTALSAAPVMQPSSFQLTQEGQHLEHLGQTVEPLVDGAEQPYLIPDDVAIRALIQTLRGPAISNNVEDFERRTDRLALEDTDKLALRQALRDFDLFAREQEARIEALRPRTVAASQVELRRFADAQARLNVMVTDAYESLQRTLSGDGGAKLRQELQDVKSHMKIWPAPDMGQSLATQ
jgi:hypothetical protein